MTTHLLEDATITLKIKDTDHNFDILDAQLFLEENADGKKMSEAVVAIKLYVKDQTQQEISSSQAVSFYNLVRSAFTAHKKKSEEELKSAFPSVWTPSQPATANTSSSETNTPAFEQLEN